MRTGANAATGAARVAGDPVLAAVCGALGRVGAGLYAVACSGGADSIALADATIRVAGATHVVVIAIDHGLYPTSAAVAARVGAWARARGAAAVIERVEVAVGASLEAAARRARYGALDRVAGAIGAVAVLLGHTARDQAETVLMRILRGTGPAGLAAMAERRGPYVRPLLAVERADVDAYVAVRALPVWDDPMNADRRFARVRIRTEVLPRLREENPRVDEALVRLAAQAAEWTLAIDALAEPWARFPLDARELARQPAAVRKRAITRALDAADLGYARTHVDAVDALVRGDARGERGVDVGRGRVVRTYDRIEAAPGRCVGRGSADDRARGEPAVGGGGWPNGQGSAADRGGGPAVHPDGHAVRTWQPGDRMRPARLLGRSRKLSDLYADAKIPRARRAEARVLVRVTDGVITWAEHVGLAFGEVAHAGPK